MNFKIIVEIIDSLGLCDFGVKFNYMDFCLYFLF